MRIVVDANRTVITRYIIRIVLLLTVVSLAFVLSLARADDTLVKFDRGIGVDPASNAPGMAATANVVTRIDPDKQQWIKAGRNQIAKCAEMGALRKGWPEDLSRVVVEEETHHRFKL